MASISFFSQINTPRNRSSESHDTVNLPPQTSYEFLLFRVECEKLILNGYSCNL
jgi:hypothetical protein